MKHRLIRTFAMLALAMSGVLGLLVGCTPEQARTIHVGTNIWPGYEPGYLAAAEGLYGAAPVRMRQFTSATEVLRAFRIDAIQVAALTLDEVLQLHQYGLDVVVILVADISDGADVILAQPEVGTVAELAGRRVAVENTALGAYLLARALQLHGVDPASVEVLPITVDESVDAYMKRRADAVVTFEPFRSKLLEAGARQIFSSAEMPSEIVDVLVTRRSTLQEHEPTLKAFVKGWLGGIDLIRQEPARMSELMAQRLDLSPKEALASFDGLTLPDANRNRTLLGSAEGGLQASARRLGEVLASSGLLKAEVTTDGLFDGRLIPPESP